METNVCCTCQKPKATLNCGICETSVCKYCAQIIADDSFSFLPKIPAELKHETYCTPCFDSKVAEPLADYQSILDRAADIVVFEKAQGKETRFFSRREKPVKVADCLDREETLMRLAFQAVKLGYNAIIDADIIGTKKRDGTRQTTIWSGTAVPCNVDSSKIPKDRSIWNNPN